MRPLASIGYNGQPVRDPFRVVRPPIAVLIDLTVLFLASHIARAGISPTVCSCTRSSKVG